MSGLSRFSFEFRDERTFFFTDHNFHLSERLHDDEFLTRLAYLSDVFYHLNDLNLGLQGLSATIFIVQDKMEAMIKKLELFSVCINKENSQVFPSLYDFLCANELKLTDNVKCDIAKHLVSWVRNYAGTFPKRTIQTTGFVIPYMPCLQSTYRYLNKRASSKLQQAVL